MLALARIATLNSMSRQFLEVSGYYSRVQAAVLHFLGVVAEVTDWEWTRSSIIRDELNIEPLLLFIQKSRVWGLAQVLRIAEDRFPLKILSAVLEGRRPVERYRHSWEKKIPDAVRGEAVFMDVAQDGDDRSRLVDTVGPQPA